MKLWALSPHLRAARHYIHTYAPLSMFAGEQRRCWSLICKSLFISFADSQSARAEFRKQEIQWNRVSFCRGCHIWGKPSFLERQWGICGRGILIKPWYLPVTPGYFSRIGYRAWTELILLSNNCVFSSNNEQTLALLNMLIINPSSYIGREKSKIK